MTVQRLRAICQQPGLPGVSQNNLSSPAAIGRRRLRWRVGYSDLGVGARLGPAARLRGRPGDLDWPVQRLRGDAVAHSQTATFRQRVRDHMQAPPVVVAGDLPALEVVARMAAAGASAAVVLDGGQRLAGILTEQNVTRRIAGRAVGEQPVARLMTSPVTTIACDQPLYQAIGVMRRHGLRHMPVVDAAGALAGMLYLHDALAIASAGLVEQIDRLTHETTLEGLRQVKAAEVALAADLVADRVPAPEIQSLVSSLNNDIHRRVLALELDAMGAEGWGVAPVAFAAIVMGSGGRGESYLFPDQDNGFILADYPDPEHTRIDAFFIELAARMNRHLDELGFPLCRGGVMAINPVWRKTLSQWRQQVSRWVARRSDVALQLADVLFDFQSVFGEAELADELRRTILALCRANPAFLRALFGVQADHRAGTWLVRAPADRARGPRAQGSHQPEICRHPATRRSGPPAGPARRHRGDRHARADRGPGPGGRSLARPPGPSGRRLRPASPACSCASRSRTFRPAARSPTSSTRAASPSARRSCSRTASGRSTTFAPGSGPS